MSLPDTRAARASILAALRAGGPPPALPEPDLAPYLAGPYARGSVGARPDPASLVAPFETAARGWRAEVVHAGARDWPHAVRQALQRHGCTRIAIGAASPLQPALDDAVHGLDVRRFDRPIEQWKHALFGEVDAGVTSAAAGIADTGTLVLCPDAHEPRTLSLVPPVHVAVLHVGTLYASLAAALRALSPQADMPANLLLVSGPSKTADIQQTLAYGAHGPKALVIVVVHDQPAAPAPQP